MTKVLVQTNGAFNAKVEAVDTVDGKDSDPVEIAVVPHGEIHDFEISATRRLIVTQLPLEALSEE